MTLHEIDNSDNASSIRKNSLPPMSRKNDIRK